MKPIDQMDRFAPGYAMHFSERGQIAFVATHHAYEGEEGPGLGIALANDQGYFPIPKYVYSAVDFSAAQDRAEALNRNLLHLTEKAALHIVASTMGGRRV